MSKQKLLGLDLATATLPDAIAAMVEAWYEAQGLGDKTTPDSLADLGELIDLILRHVVEWKDGKGRPKENTVAELIKIRKDQMIGGRSNVDRALYRCGISYRGGHDDFIRLKWAELPLLISCADHEVRLKNALSNCPSSKFF